MLNNENMDVKIRRRFTKGSVEFIVMNAGKITAKDIADKLERSEKSIRRKAEKIGISLRVKK